jgi:hypothetical protein
MPSHRKRHIGLGQACFQPSRFQGAGLELHVEAIIITSIDSRPEHGPAIRCERKGPFQSIEIVREMGLKSASQAVSPVAYGLFADIDRHAASKAALEREEELNIDASTTFVRVIQSSPEYIASLRRHDSSHSSLKLPRN